MLVQGQRMSGRGCAFAEAEYLGAGLTELPRLAQGLDRAARLKIWIDLDEGLWPILLGRILRVYESTDVIGFDAREASSELGVLVDYRPGMIYS